MNYGSSNAYKFGIQTTAFLGGRSGEAQTKYADVRTAWSDPWNTGHLLHVVMTPTPGDLVLWRYLQNGTYDPQLWVVADSAGAIVYAWEGEHKIHPRMSPETNPIITSKQDGSSIIPAGGRCIRASWPGWSFDDSIVETLNSINTLVAAAAIPAWVTGTEFERHDTVAELLRGIFQNFQATHSLHIYTSIANALMVDAPPEVLRIYTLLWLRAASMILYAHAGETAIPLICGHFTVDEYGNISYSA